MSVKLSVRVDEDLKHKVDALAIQDSTSFTKLLQDALRLYLDYRYLEGSATIINEETRTVFKASMNLLEKRINNRSNKLLSELAIQQGVIMMVIAKNLEMRPDELERYRAYVVNGLKQENRVFKLEDVIDDF